MTDRLLIEQLRARAVLGVGAEERAAPQQILLNLALELDLGPAGRSDRIEETVHYGELSRQVLSHVESTSFFLIEALAHSICRFVLDRYPRVLALTVRVEKPARSVAAEIRRSRSNSD